MDFSGTKIKDAGFEECKGACFGCFRGKSKTSDLWLLWVMYTYIYLENKIMYR